MKKILPIFIFLLLCSQTYAGNVVMMCGEGTSTAASCALYDELTGTDYNDSATENDGWIGQILYNPTTNITVCRIGFNFYTDPGGATVTMAIYTPSGENLGSAVVSASGAISGTGWKYLDVSPTLLSHGTSYQVVTKVASGVAGIYISTTQTLDAGYLAKWAADGTIEYTYSNLYVGMRLYTQ